ncbi:MAG: hypothetical protein BZ137_00300 [Methanosphaera sp. rholeuAM130]|nr:MAG: hypothetical protein BZ137_00300 [Methanosphaera sp. rholeuAM130]
MNDRRNFESDADKCLNEIIHDLRYDRYFYECDITMEYSLFESSVKDYCDKYIVMYLENNDNEEAFRCLVKLSETIIDVEDDMSDEDYFRPSELITYYFARIISLSNGSLKNRIHNWMYKLVEKYEGISYLVDNYFKVFLEGDMIYHADEYYTNYDDYDEVLSYYKS